MAVLLQGPNPVTEPGNDETNTDLMLCASVSSSPGNIERDTVVTVSSTQGTAGIGIVIVVWLYYRISGRHLCSSSFIPMHVYTVCIIIVTGMIVFIQVLMYSLQVPVTSSYRLSRLSFLPPWLLVPLCASLSPY